MESSILSEVDNTSISGRSSQTRQRFPLSWLPVSRPPRSGLERSDFVLWQIAKIFCNAKLDRYRGMTDVAGPTVGPSRSRMTRPEHHDVASGAPGLMPCL